MALSIATFPKTYNPAYNDIIVQLSSNFYANANFKYIVQVQFYKDGVQVGTTLILRKSPNASGTGIFNLGRIAENYLSYDISNIDEVVKNTNSFIKCTLQFSTEWTGGSELIFGSSSFYVFNGVLSYSDFPSYTVTPYLNPTATRFLTRCPHSTNLDNTIKIGASDSAFLHFMQNGTADKCQFLEVTTYDINKTLIDTWQITNPYATQTVDSERFLRFPSGTYNLNQINNTDLATGVQPIITASTYYYSISIDGDDGYTAIQNYKIDRECSQYTNFRLQFLNKLGGFDGVNFKLRSDENLSIQRENFKSFTPYNYTAITPAGGTFNINSKTNIIINSDWLTDAEFVWLKELLESPIVFHETTPTTFIPIMLTDLNYSIKKRINDKLQQLTLSFNYTYNNNTQRQ